MRPRILVLSGGPYHPVAAQFALLQEDLGERAEIVCHPVVAGVDDFELEDELYCNVQIAPGMDFTVHAWAPYHGLRLPMIVTAEGGRVSGAGRTAFLANGHDLKALDCEGFRRAAVNTLSWLLSE